MSTMPAQSLFPDREHIIDDVRNGAIASAVVDTVYSFLKGLCCTPSGRRLAGGVQEVVTSAPDIACGAAKYGVRSGIQSVVAHARQTDDHWNSVVAYGSAAALFSVHTVGPLAALSSGLDEVAADVAYRGFVHLFWLDHRCRLPELAARYAAGFPGLPAQSIVVEVVSVDKSGEFRDVSFPDKIDANRC